MQPRQLLQSPRALSRIHLFQLLQPIPENIVSCPRPPPPPTHITSAHHIPSTKTAPSGIATCGSSVSPPSIQSHPTHSILLTPPLQRISSACSCLTTTTTTTTSSSKTTAKTTTATTASPKTTTPSSVTTTAPATFPFPTSTCTGRLLSVAGCPTPYDHCCQYVCEEAQVPYDVCSLTNGSGEYAVCSSCPSPTPTWCASVNIVERISVCVRQVTGRGKYAFVVQ